jgi:hypothetical protein
VPRPLHSKPSTKCVLLASPVVGTDVRVAVFRPERGYVVEVTLEIRVSGQEKQRIVNIFCRQDNDEFITPSTTIRTGRTYSC